MAAPARFFPAALIRCELFTGMLDPHVLKSIAQTKDYCVVVLNIGQAFCV